MKRSVSSGGGGPGGPACAACAVPAKQRRPGGTLRRPAPGGAEQAAEPATEAADSAGWPLSRAASPPASPPAAAGQGEQARGLEKELAARSEGEDGSGDGVLTPELQTPLALQKPSPLTQQEAQPQLSPGKLRLRASARLPEEELSPE